MRIVWLSLAACFFLAFAPPASAGQVASAVVLRPTEGSSGIKRFAIVIGNGDYQNVQTLRNPKNDAAAVAAKLQQIGYSVVYGHDLDRRGMNEAVETFLALIEPGSEALVYYSGHGVDLNGSNYLLPTDIPALDPDQERMLRVEGVNVTDLLLDLQGKSARVNIVILDACRDNPFRVASAGSLTRSLGATRGLAAVEPPRGTFIMFAAGVGEQALDNLGSNDNDPNGLFTRKLLAHMDQNGLEIHSLVLQLRTEVQEAALSVGGHNQTPGYYDQLLGEFYFRPKTMAPDGGQTGCDQLVDERADKDVIMSRDVDADLQACARAVVEHPAEMRLMHLLQVAQEQRAFQRALRSEDRGPSDAYLVLYPDGRFVDDIKLRLANLAPVPPTPPSPVLPPIPKIDPAEVARVLQVELKRVGCDPNAVDGDWGASSERALARFDEQTHSSFSAKIASVEAIDAVRTHADRVCPLECRSKEHLVKGRCVAVTKSSSTPRPNPIPTPDVVSPAERSAKSIECSKRADGLELHGTERQAFRAKCKQGQV